MSAKILTQFVDNLEQTVLIDVDASAADPAPTVAEDEAVASGAAAVDAATPESDVPDSPAAAADTAAATAAPTVRKIDQPEPEAIDLLESAGTPVLKRAVPVFGVAVAALIVWRLLRRRR